MNWLQESLMMSSTVASPAPGSAHPPHPAPAPMFPASSPSSTSSSPAAALAASYEGRMSMIPGLQPPAYPSPYQSQFTANLNFNLINNPYNKHQAPASKPEAAEDRSFEAPGNLSPSSGTGSPRTDETLDKTSDTAAEADTSHEAETSTGLEMLRQQADSIPAPAPAPGPGLTIRQDIQTQMGKNENKSEDEEIHDVEEAEEELLIDEEMEEADSSRDKHEETFEEVPVDKVDSMKQFSTFQPYLNVKEATAGEGAINSLEKLQQALNNRIFDTTEAKTKTTSIVTPCSNAVNGNVKDGKEEESGGCEYKFSLPPDEEGIVYQCHLCSYTATTRVNFNAHVNTHYDFQCVKCDFEDKSESTYVRHLKEEHNCTPEDLEEAEVRVPRVNSQGKVKTFKCKQCEFVAVTKLEFWKHGRGHIKPEKLLFCPKCIFVTEYKHHLEYHLRNHYGTKPFRCTNCNYSCVNKSMLNSHMKSHTNVYQYRCADCTYATKYCHSLKLHLKKYGHKPAMVLNNDGSPNPLPVIDVFGNKRGPKNAKSAGPEVPPSPVSGLFPSLPPNFPGSLPNLPNFPPNFPFLGLSQLHQLQQQSQLGGPKIAQVPPFRLEDPDQDREERGVSPPTMEPEKLLRCEKCEFSTSSPEVHKNHLLLHASSERGALHRLLTSPLNGTAKSGSGSEDLGFSPSRKRTASPASPRSPFPAARPLFGERSVSPVSSSPMDYFNKIAIANPLLQGLVPNPAIKALMESRKRDSSVSSSPDSARTLGSHEDAAPLPPNKRIKTDIFASLYANANKMSELAAEKSGGESPSGVLDLSKECHGGHGDNVIGGGSHGSSSDNESGSNPRSHSSSPSLTSSTTKNRRKGKAYKIERPRAFDLDTNSEEDSPADMPGLLPIPRAEQFAAADTCKFCGISFKSKAMHAIHMGYHAPGSDPFKCNLCGDRCDDALSFFLHIARKEHT